MDCGAMTARLNVDADFVTWSDWRWDSSAGAEMVPQLSEPARFDQTAYVSTATI